MESDFDHVFCNMTTLAAFFYLRSMFLFARCVGRSGISRDTGGPVLVVGGEEHNTNAHKMAVGSEVHLIAKTQTEATTAEAISASRHEAGSGGVNERGGGSSGKGPAVPGISIFASLHRKLIVRQVFMKRGRERVWC